MHTFPRLLLAGLLAFGAVGTFAQEDLSGEPDVTIREEEDKTIEEYRVNGFLYAIKVTPKFGKPYFLVRADGNDANFVRSDEPTMRIPAWKIFEW
ncbi:DUF2782 domain-containing protein [Azotobacter sp. CWF10]